MLRVFRLAVWLGLTALCYSGCVRSQERPPASAAETASYETAYETAARPQPTIPATTAQKVVARARQEVERGVTYDAGYRNLSYPNGDVPSNKGACTDVVIRAFRAAGYDLQRLIHEDMRRSFSAYPPLYGLRRPDQSIDHRRVPNQVTFFRRHGKALPLSTTGDGAKSWQPGDIVYWKLDSGLDHCGIVSDRRGPSGLPLVIHNLSVAAEEDCLTAWRITGHFRYPGEPS
jgi:uncharacterized protein YijF (DUF1287 family)